MAHQWFGNLVTMQWWDDIWLNEAFATWFAEKMVDAWQPAYERGTGRVHARGNAMVTDGLLSARRIRQPIVVRGDIFNAFDSITYQKGATVIGMFEGWVGDEPFRRGVRTYLDQHRYGSGTVRDFLDALGAASGRPVAPAFATFLDQNGVPEVGVALECSKRGARLALSQRRLSAFGASAADQQWQIPVCARYGTGQASRTACTLLTERQGLLELQQACPAFVVANAGGRGYYVPAYSPDFFARLAKHRDALTPAEYASVLYDLRSLVRAGSVSSRHALEWIRVSAKSRDRHVMLAAIESRRSFATSSCPTTSGRILLRMSGGNSVRAHALASRRAAAKATTTSCCAGRCSASSHPRIRHWRRRRASLRVRGWPTAALSTPASPTPSCSSRRAPVTRRSSTRCSASSARPPIASTGAT
jgi:alanyl aminopeptidase